MNALHLVACLALMAIPFFALWSERTGTWATGPLKWINWITLEPSKDFFIIQIGRVKVKNII